MKIFIICSKVFYHKIPSITAKLKMMGHDVILPNCIDDPTTEDKYKQLGNYHHSKFKSRMFYLSEKKVNECDAVLVLNMEKNNIPGYIGGGTFLEIYDAFRLSKKIYLYNPIENSIFSDEMNGFSPLILNGNIHLIENK